MSTTPGPWALRGCQIRADDGKGQHVATYQICRDDGLLLAAAPMLLAFAEKKAQACDECEGTGFYPPHKPENQRFACEGCADARACINAVKRGT